jgi:ubiquinone/menaquinone biosynthesis C-methylase UbiE
MNTSQRTAAYVHLGRSSGGILSAERVLQEIDLREGQTFLDAGAGDGHISLVAARLVGPAGHVYAVDVRAEVLAPLLEAIRAQQITNIQPLVVDLAGPLPFPTASVDVSLISNVLHELVENEVAASALRELARVLKLGGTLAVVDFKQDGDPAFGPPLARRLGPAQVVALVAPFGFREERSVEVGPQHYAVLLRREG